MFLERTFQAQIIQEDLQRTPKYDSYFKKPKKKSNVVYRKLKAYLHLFLNTSSIHGLNHLVAPGRHTFEILLWLTVIVLSALGSFYLSVMTWSRYQSSPTVVSMDRDMFAWNTTFPCVTVCPEKKLDPKKLEAFLRNSNEENKTALEEFIRALSNVTYKNMKDMPNYSGIPADEYIDLLLNLSGAFKPTLTIGVANIVLTMVPTITEMGLCYSINSPTAVYNSPDYRKANKWDVIVSQNKSLTIHPLDGEVFAQVMNMSTPYDIYIHGPQEVPDISTKHLHSDEGYYMKLLHISQRRCRFPHENNLKHNTIYTYTMCRMECRIRLCLKYCQCIPHFYRRIGDEKICDTKGWQCLSTYKDQLFKLQEKSGKRIECGCFPLCDDVNYVIQSNALQEWFLGTNLQWGVVTYPRLRYRRDIIFGFTDVLVSVGGMAGLFLGCSVLSFMEIVYFLSLRLFCYSKGLK